MPTRLLQFSLFLLFLPCLALAQDGKIAGTVVDRTTQEPLPGATVVIEGTTRGAATSVSGEFVILDIAPGTYALRISFVGYGSQVVQGIDVSSGFTSLVDASLTPGIELEEVVVQAERMIRQDEVSTTTVMRGEDIQALPVDNFQDAMTLAGGVVESGTGQNIHVRGGRTGELAYIVDGVLVEDPLSGSIGGFDVARQSISELQVLTGGFSAEYGKAMSGIVLINTPSGGNDYHGSLRIQTDGYSMDGIGLGGPTFGETRPFENDWGTRQAEISLSGPVFRDKVSFFMNLDRLDTDSYLNDFDGPVRPAVFSWNDLVGYSFYRTSNNSFKDAAGQDVDVDFDAIGLAEGDVITQNHVNQLRDLGVDVDHFGEAAVSDYQSHHALGLYNDRTRLVANLGFHFTQDMDARISYKLTRRDALNYSHGYKYLPQYNNKVKRNIDVIGAQFTHRLSPSMFYEVLGSYSTNNLFNYVYDENLDSDDPWRFGRIFPAFSGVGVFDTQGLSDAEGGNNYDFNDFSNSEIYIEYPLLLTGDMGEPFMVSRNLDLDSDGTFDVLRGDRLTDSIISQLQGLYDTLTDEELQEIGLSRGMVPIQSPPTDNVYLERRIKDLQLSANFSAQLNEKNYLKVGIQYRNLILFNHSINANNEWDPSTNPADPATRTRDPNDEDYIDVSPFEFAAFATDKIEFMDLVVQVGVRLDMLDSKMQTLATYGGPEPVQRPYTENDPVPEAVDSELKYQVSPRLGIAFPITDRARLSFNYGQFLQYPEYNRLYQNYRQATWIPGSGYVPIDDFGFDLGFETFLGNPNIEPERTIFYQFDAEFLVSETFKLGTSLTFKDIYDYVTVRRILGQGGRAFWVMDNLDYANYRGFEIRAEKRLERYFGFMASYTYGRAVGNADDYQGAFDDWYSNSVSGTLPPKGSQPLDWDQPHTLNFTVNTRYQDFSANFLGRFGSGMPYTPTSERGRPLGPKNSARQPWTGVIDVRFEYHFDLPSNAYIRPFFEVTNLLDRKNVLAVFTTTGSPDYSLDPGTQYEDAQRPHFFGPPRHFELGFQLGF